MNSDEMSLTRELDDCRKAFSIWLDKEFPPIRNEVRPAQRLSAYHAGEFVSGYLANRIAIITRAYRDLAASVGTPPLGSHPDEAKPRAATWHAERSNWLAEVAVLRSELARAKTAIDNCLQHANGREREWGERAVTAIGFLHEYAMGSQAALTKRD
jgi:hypothetical protein